MNHKELRRECEPDYRELCDEISRLMPKTQPMDNKFPIDYALIQRVLRRERERELEKQWKAQNGLREKRSSSSVTGKKANVA